MGIPKLALAGRGDGGSSAVGAGGKVSCAAQGGTFCGRKMVWGLF